MGLVLVISIWGAHVYGVGCDLGMGRSNKRLTAWTRLVKGKIFSGNGHSNSEFQIHLSKFSTRYNWNQSLKHLRSYWEYNAQENNHIFVHSIVQDKRNHSQQYIKFQCFLVLIIKVIQYYLDFAFHQCSVPHANDLFNHSKNPLPVEMPPILVQFT
jgi:hypothetical protein